MYVAERFYERLAVKSVVRCKLLRLFVCAAESLRDSPPPENVEVNVWTDTEQQNLIVIKTKSCRVKCVDTDGTNNSRASTTHVSTLWKNSFTESCLRNLYLAVTLYQ